MSNFFKERKTISRTKTVEVIEEIEIDVWDWDSIPHGSYLECTINGKKLTGVLVKEGDAEYIVHNNVEFLGSTPKFNYGYNYGWQISFSQINKGTSDVNDISFPEPPEDFVPLLPKPVITQVGNYDAFITADSIKVGCQTISRETVEYVLKAMDEIKLKTNP